MHRLASMVAEYLARDVRGALLQKEPLFRSEHFFFSIFWWTPWRFVNVGLSQENSAPREQKIRLNESKFLVLRLMEAILSRMTLKLVCPFSGSMLQS